MKIEEIEEAEKLKNIKADEVGIVSVYDKTWSIDYIVKGKRNRFKFNGEKTLVVHPGWSCFASESRIKNVVAVASVKNMVFNIKNIKIKILRGLEGVNIIAHVEGRTEEQIEDNVFIDELEGFTVRGE